MAIDPLRLAIACIPLAAYALVIGLVNLRRRPLLVSGGADLTALGRLATAEDVADAVLFLSSSLSSSTTGHLIPVDSGLL